MLDFVALFHSIILGKVGKSQVENPLTSPIARVKNLKTIIKNVTTAWPVSDEM